jgi:hypothetical protein
MAMYLLNYLFCMLVVAVVVERMMMMMMVVVVAVEVIMRMDHSNRW